MERGSRNSVQRILYDWATATNAGGGAFTYDPTTGDFDSPGPLWRQLDMEAYAAQCCANKLRGLARRAHKLMREVSDGEA